MVTPEKARYNVQDTGSSTQIALAQTGYWHTDRAYFALADGHVDSAGHGDQFQSTGGQNPSSTAG